VSEDQEIQNTATVQAPVEPLPVQQVEESPVPQVVEPVPQLEPRKTQKAEVISSASLPGVLWAFHIAYINDAGEKIITQVFFGPGQFPLWKSPTTPVAITFNDYNGDVLVYPTEQVVHSIFTGTTKVNAGSIYRHLYR